MAQSWVSLLGHVDTASGDTIGCVAFRLAESKELKCVGLAGGCSGCSVERRLGETPRLVSRSPNTEKGGEYHRAVELLFIMKVLPLSGV